MPKKKIKTILELEKEWSKEMHREKKVGNKGSIKSVL